MLVDSYVCQEQTATDTLKYLCNHQGIENHYRLEHGGSCAEGLVSHVLSKRFLRDPLGWGIKNLCSLSDLRIYQLNGGGMGGWGVQGSEKKAARGDERVAGDNPRLRPYGITLGKVAEGSQARRLWKLNNTEKGVALFFSDQQLDTV